MLADIKGLYLIFMCLGNEMLMFYPDINNISRASLGLPNCPGLYQTTAFNLQCGISMHLLKMSMSTITLPQTFFTWVKGTNQC